MGIDTILVKHNLTLLEHVEQKWNDLLKAKNQNPFPNVRMRYCTSNHKRLPISKYISKQHPSNENSKILICTGERWEESSRRSKYDYWTYYVCSTSKRKVYNWRPMLAFETVDVWSEINNTKMDFHEAYKHGCDRLGCVVCIFHGECGHGLKDAQINCKNNQELYEKLDKLEQDTKFTISVSRRFIRDLIKLK